MSKEKIIDFEKKGNVVRFYFGTDDEYYGDEWGSIPYEGNAGKVGKDFIIRIVDVAFSYEYTVVEPADDVSYECGSPYCKRDMKNGDVPCILLIPDEIAGYEKTFLQYVGSQRVLKIYFNDTRDVFKTIPGAIILLDEVPDYSRKEDTTK